MKPKRKVLKNGLRIVAVPMKENPTVTAMVMVEAGSHYENKGNNGISHFLEHMCFKGTTRRPSTLSISHELDSLGSQSNAFTWYEMTAYYAKSRAKNFKKILDVMADLYLHPLVPDAELQKEKGVILEEINMYKDLPAQDVQRLLHRVMYGDQPAGWSVLGVKENIRSMTREKFLAYRSAHYVAKKTTVVVAGSVTARDVFREVERLFANTSVAPLIKKQPVKDTQRDIRMKVQDKKTDQTHLALGFRSFPVSDRRSTTTDVLSTILGRGMSSRLFQKLREEMGVCYYVRAQSSQLTDSGKFIISTGVDNKRVGEVVGVILDELRHLHDEKVDDEELRKAKEYTAGNFLMGVEGSDDLVEFYGMQEIMRQKIKTPQDIIREIKAVTARDIQNVAREVFQNKKMNLALIGPHATVAGQLRKNLRL